MTRGLASLAAMSVIVIGLVVVNARRSKPNEATTGRQPHRSPEWSGRSVPTEVPTTPVLVLPAIREGAQYTADGIISGILGAATIALWFLLVDAVHGRPLYTPTVLGTTLFRDSAAVPALDTLPVSVEMVVMYSAVHALIFAAIGGLASRLLAIAERYPEVAFGILVLFVVFEFAVTVGPILFAAPVVRALTWPAVLVANLLATAAMAGFLWHRHSGLRMNP